MLKNFIILTTPRTGSTFLRLWLNNHPEIRCHGEIFLRRYNARDGYKYYCSRRYIRNLIYKSIGNKITSRLPLNFFLKQQILEYLESLYHNPNHSGPWTTVDTWNEYQPTTLKNKYVGFKLMESTFREFRPLKSILTAQNFKVIILHRENILNTYLSRLSLHNNQIAHSHKNTKQKKVFVNPENLTKELEKIHLKKTRLHNLLPTNETIHISYEEMFMNINGTAKKIQDFLKLRPCTIPCPSLKKINPTSQVNRIENYQSVVNVLKQTPYEKYLTPLQ